MTDEEVEEACRVVASANGMVFRGAHTVPQGATELRFANQANDYFGVFLLDEETETPAELHGSLAELMDSMQKGARLQDRIRRGRAKREYVCKHPDGGDVYKFDRKTLECLTIGSRFGKQEVRAIDLEQQLAVLI